MIGIKRKRHLFGAESTFQESVSKQNFYACTKAKKSDVAATFRLHSAQCKIALKELRNRVSHIIRLWSLFCSILVYASLHFLLIHLENYFLSFCGFCLKFDVIFIHFITFAQSFFGHVICVFILTYEKQFVNVIKI